MRDVAVVQSRLCTALLRVPMTRMLEKLSNRYYVLKLLKY